jgi:tetratricopeptide (TPR) repeat protein
MAGDFDAARERAAQARTTLDELGLAVRAAEAAGWAVSEIELLAGRADAAEPPLRESCGLLGAMRASSPLATRSAALAEVLYLQGRLDDAESWCETAERHAGRDDLSAQVGWRGVRAKLLARRGELDEAERVARAAVSLSAPTDSLNARARCLLDLAEVLRTRGLVEGGSACVHEALQLYERKENVVARERAARLLTEPAAA